MNLPDHPPNSLDQSELVTQLLPDALALLENDFRTSGMEISLSGQIIGDVFDLRTRVAEGIAKTGGPGSEQFYRLLYRADIPEAKIRALLATPGDLPFEEQVAELLIIRALQKAFFRKKFSGI